jgi:hypothetical protein
MTDDPTAALPEPLAHAMAGQPCEVGAPWTPDQPLRFDATMQELANRLTFLQGEPCGFYGAEAKLAREYAEARVAASVGGRIVIREMHRTAEAEARLAAAETALAAARAEVERLKGEVWRYLDAIGAEVVMGRNGDDLLAFERIMDLIRELESNEGRDRDAALAARLEVSNG